LLRECCNAFLASFKIWNAATVGGNICMSLPAGPMISLVVALEATLTLWPRNAPPREIRAVDFVTGNHMNVLQRGELLRSIHLPARALCKRFAFRRASLTRLGRSAALLIGTRSADADDLLITITAATPRPLQLFFDRAPSAEDLRHAIDALISADFYFDDVHGTPAYKRHLTYYFAEQIRAELARPGKATRPGAGIRTIPSTARSSPPSRSPVSACARSCAITVPSASRRAATRAIAAHARSGSTECRCTPA